MRGREWSLIAVESSRWRRARTLGPQGAGPIPSPAGRLQPIRSALWYELSLHFTLDSFDSVLTCTTFDTPNHARCTSRQILHFPNIVKRHSFLTCLMRLSKTLTHYGNARETTCRNSIDR